MPEFEEVRGAQSPTSRCDCDHIVQPHHEPGTWWMLRKQMAEESLINSGKRPHRAFDPPQILIRLSTMHNPYCLVLQMARSRRSISSRENTGRHLTKCSGRNLACGIGVRCFMAMRSSHADAPVKLLGAVQQLGGIQCDLILWR